MSFVRRFGTAFVLGILCIATNGCAQFWPAVPMTAPLEGYVPNANASEPVPDSHLTCIGPTTGYRARTRTNTMLAVVSSVWTCAIGRTLLSFSKWSAEPPEIQLRVY